MSVSLSLISGRLMDERLQSVTRELCGQLNDQGEITAEVPKTQAGAGHKGDIITVGTLALTFLTSGAAVALFEVAKAYFERDKSLILKLTDEDGRVFEVTAENISSGQIDQTINMAKGFIG